MKKLFLFALALAMSANILAQFNEKTQRALSTDAEVLTPIFSNVSGLIQDTAYISLSCNTEGASIYYTTNGSTPSATNGTLYDEPIFVNVKATDNYLTIKAIAIKDGVSSAVVSQGYLLRRTTCYFYVSYNNAVFGSISVPESAKYGDEITITVNPSEGYVLDYIYIPEGSIGNITDNKFVVPARTGSVHLYVYFKIDTYMVTVNAGEHGSVIATTIDGLPVDLTTSQYGKKIYLTATPDEGYEVDEWINYDPATGLTVTHSVTVSVTFKKKSYHVRFVDYDNITILKEEDVLYQEAATAPTDPTREGYTFAGWDKDFSSITAATTIKATYTVNSYMVTVVANHGTVTAKDIENNPRDLSQPVEYGTVILLTATPDADWLFDHWENYDYTTGLTVAGNITVTAVFKKQSYTVTFMDYDNTVLKEEEVAHGESATAPADPTREGYTFGGWDKDFSNITDYTIVKATYTKNTYVVTIVAEHGTVAVTDGDNNPIDLSQPIEYGKVIWLIANPDEGYELENWTNYNPVTGLTVMENVTVTATFKQTMYHVIFVDYDDTVLKEEDVLYKAAATAPAAPTREGYTFTGWSQDFSSVTSNITVKATYTINMYSVTVISEHGEVIAKDSENNPVILNQPMEYGTHIWLEVTPDANWLFDHWENYDYTTGLTVTGNITVTAVFRKQSYIVTFMDYDNTVLKEEEVAHGEAATAPADPTREGYTFAGWDKEFSSITAALTVKATYTINTYAVTVVAEHGSVSAADADNNPVDLSQPIEYGKVIFLTATPDEHWLFDHWDGYNAETGLTVTDNITVTAVFVPNTEGIENIISGENATKVLIDGQILILRGEKIYTLQGAEVR